MAKEYRVPDLPEELGIEISVKKAEELVGGDGMPTVYNIIRVYVRNTGADPMRVTFTVEGRHRDTGEVRKTRTLRHGDWSEMSPGSRRGKEFDPGNLTWFLVAVEVERGNQTLQHRMQHQIAHVEPGCLGRIVVPCIVLVAVGVLMNVFL